MGSAAVLVGSLALSLGAGAVGGIATAKVIPTWYAQLRKPRWNPPNWTFGPVWTALYILMAVAAWLVWRQDGFGAWTAIYLVQLALNMIWTFLFFGRRRLDWAFYEVIALWIAILATTIVFWSRDPIAGAMFLPYLAWVAFASNLNRVVWSLNR